MGHPPPALRDPASGRRSNAGGPVGLLNAGCAASAFFTASALFLTFSRGAYLAMLTFILALLGSAMICRSRRILAIGATLILIVTASAIAANMLSAGAVLKTVAIHSSEQQKRSSQGRLNVWSRSLRLASAHPVFGSGPGKFAMLYLPNAGLAEGHEFVGRPLNSGLTVLVETGLAGLTCYVLIALAATRSAMARAIRAHGRSYFSVTLLAGFWALAVREATFSSFLENGTVTLLSSLLVAMLVAERKRLSGTRSVPARRAAFRALFWVLVLCAGWVFLGEYRRDLAGEWGARAAQEINSGRPEDAILSANRAVKIDPTAYQLSVRAMALAAMHMPGFDSHFAAVVTRTADRRGLEQAMADLDRAIEESPEDDLLFENRAWVRMSLGEGNAGIIRDLARAVEIDGSVAAYHVALGLIWEREGNKAAAADQYSDALTAAPAAVDSGFARDFRLRDPDWWGACVTEAIKRLGARNPDGRDTVDQARLARLYMEQGDVAMAHKILGQVTRSMPQLPRPWANLAYAEFVAGDLERAETALRKSLFLDGSFCPARTLLADIQRNGGNRDAAADSEGPCEMGIIRHNSPHASRVGRLYKTEGTVVADDILPPGLAAYCEPRSFVR